MGSIDFSMNAIAVLILPGYPFSRLFQLLLAYKSATWDGPSLSPYRSVPMKMWFRLGFGPGYPNHIYCDNFFIIIVKTDLEKKKRHWIYGKLIPKRKLVLDLVVGPFDVAGSGTLANLSKSNVGKLKVRTQLIQLKKKIKEEKKGGTWHWGVLTVTRECHFFLLLKYYRKF